jgi:O-antigen/teichoic acid export membrane protein
MSTAVAETSPKRGEAFLHSVVWSWFGVAVNIFAGFYLAAFIIHRLGTEVAGIWAVLTGFIDNFWNLDLGFRSATLKYTAHYRALNQPDKVNEAINTGLASSGSICLLTMIATLLFTRQITSFLKIEAQYADIFTNLLLMVGVVWATGAVFNLFTAVLDGYQRFDLSSRIWIIQIAVRSLGIMAVLATGHGLIDMGKAILVSLTLMYILTYLAVRRVFPQLKISPRFVTYPMFREMLHYGLHTFGGNIALQALNQSPTMLITHFLGSQTFVTYFTQPQRLLQYSVDMVSRVGFITGSHTAELATKGDYAAIARIGIIVNRYCLMLFFPLALALIVYGPQLFYVWINPEVSLMSAPVIPVLALGTTLAIAAQFNSSAILYGLGKHQPYAYSQMVEAALCVGGLCWAIPHDGILGAAWVVSGLLLANRAIVLSILVCRALHFNVAKYLGGIYLTPMIAAIPTFLLSLWVQQHWFSANKWRDVLAGGALLAAAYYAIAFLICLEPQHRSMPLRWVKARLGRAA